MLIHLFERELTQQELTEAAARQGITGLPVMDNPMQQTEAPAKAIDADVVASLVNAVSAASHKLHVMYQLENISLPMLSLYMDLEQATVFSYNRSGIRVSRMLNPQELKRLLIECFADLPMIPSADDMGCIIAGSNDTVQLVKQICAGETADIEPLLSRTGIDCNDITAALRMKPGVRCVFEDDESRHTSYYGISDGELVYCIYPGDNSVNITKGSARPVIDAVSRGWMARCRALIRAASQNS